MRLTAAVVPPPAVLEDLDRLLDSAGRDPRQLEFTPRMSLHITLTKFGNVSHRDAVTLARRLAEEAQGWPAVDLRFTGGAALEWPGDDSLWVRLGGDLDQLSTIAHAIPALVRPMGFLVDRRVFRTWMRVGRITGGTTAEYLQGLLDALEGYRGPVWTLTEVSLLGTTKGVEPDRPYPVFEHLSLRG